MEQKQPDEKTLQDSQKHYSEEGFWNKVAGVAKKAGIKIIYLALVLYYTANAETTSIVHKGIIYGALGYFILPIDLLPDPVPIVGFTDDMAALGACLATVAMSVTPAIQEQAKERLRIWFGDYKEKDIEGLIKNNDKNEKSN
ncbi:MAG: DUF1232 domain-containing protein [Bacteroidales bacterium]|nr:DUF1232 domain-containing protein [Bacteroidales bacterium]